MKAIAYLICYLIYPFSFIFKRRKERWAFGSFRGAFNDNSKYLFIYASQNCKEKQIAWLSNNRKTVELVRKKGLTAYSIFTFKGAWYALTSKYWFFNSYTSDILFCLSGGATCINLWHGVGLKRIEFNTQEGPLAERFVKKTFKERFFHPESFRKPDYLLSSTPFQTAMFAKAFRIDEEQCLNLGYPRNNILTCNEEERINFIKEYEPASTAQIISRIKRYNRSYIYMPTWRDSQRRVFSQSMDLERLNTLLSERNELLILKPHANTIVDSSIVNSLTNITLLSGATDVYAVLPYINTLITDYSSILYDFILMEGKNVILYLYDYQEYVKERDFYYPFDENVVGVKVHTFDGLYECIKGGAYGMNSTKRGEIIEKFWGESIKLNASEIITKIIDNR